jgi:hypothetical protein
MRLDGPRTVHDSLEKRNICSCREGNLDFAVQNLVNVLNGLGILVGFNEVHSVEVQQN